MLPRDSIYGARPLFAPWTLLSSSFVFVYYERHLRGSSFKQVAKAIWTARSDRPRPGEAVHEELRPGRLLSPEFNTYVLYFGIALGVGTQLPKLTAYSGGSGAVLWTKVWAWLHFGSWIVVEVTLWLARLADRNRALNRDRDEIEGWVPWMPGCEKLFGVLAVLAQLGILAAVDLKAIPFDPNIPLRWWFRGVRFAAHGTVFLVHLPFLKIGSKIDAQEAVPSHYMGVLLIFTLVPHVVSALTQEIRFSSLYFMISIMISYFSWMLYFFSWTKKWFLFCEPGGRIDLGNRRGAENRRELEIRVERQHGVAPGKTGWRNVLAFDFFLRLVFFSAFWYVVHYDPTGTAKPQWTNNLG